MMYMLFGASSLLFVLSLLVLFAVEIAVAEAEEGGWGLMWVAIWIALAVAFTDFNPLPWITSHPILLGIGVIVYVAAGVGYALFRWWLLLRDPREYSMPKRPLNPARYRERITSWMMWWPPSLTWWVLRWPRQVFTALYHRMEQMAARAVGSGT